MRTLVNLLTTKPRLFVLAAVAASSVTLCGQDSELTNYKSGIDAIWGGTKGTDYYEEYFYHDKLIWDAKVVYIKSTTPITLATNSRNTARYNLLDGGFQVVGLAGKNPLTADEGIIRYKIDRDRQYLYKWADNFARTNTAVLLPAYSGPFTLASQQYEPGVPVVGTTGSNGGSVSSKSGYYYRGILDASTDEWHVLSYGHDDEAFLRSQLNSVDQKFWASDGKTVLLVVNPKTPCFTARASGSGQFYTTPPKAYFTPKIVPQTTYISGTVSIELRDINGNNVHYRINSAGAFTDAGASSVTLNETNFNPGTNTLDYHYTGGVIKTRTIVKDPPFPSAGEPHGNYLFVDDAGYAAVLSRITRAPYLSTYNGYKNVAGPSGHEYWDANAGRGLRIAGTNGASFALKNMFVAKVQGWNYTRPGASKSHGRYAKEMILENSRTIDPLGFELQHSADSIPNRELHILGYYDSLPVLDTLFAYDIMVANFRSDQVSGGLTPIEDHFVRDRLAGFAYEGMQWSADMCLMGSPGNTMWGCARMLAAQSIAMVLREYSSPYYGTSGFGAVQTTYPLCPYETDQLTWKQALFDNTAPRKSYPNLTWYPGLSDIDPESLFMSEGQTRSGVAYPVATWFPKAAYFSSGIMAPHLMIWANMAKLWGGGRTDARLEIAFERATKGSFIGAVDPYPQTPQRFALLMVLNPRWPNLVANNLAYVQSLPSSDNNSDDKAMQDAGVWGFAWYDDLAAGATPPPPPPPPVDLAPSNAKVNISISNP